MVNKLQMKKKICLKIKLNNMLYVIQCNDLFKIGFTTSEENTKKYYEKKYKNAKIIKTVEGNRIDLQHIYNQIGKQDWYDDTIINVFNNYQSNAWNNWEIVKNIIDNAVCDIIENYLNGIFNEYKLPEYEADMCKALFDRTEHMNTPKDYMKYDHMRRYLTEGRGYSFMLIEFICKHWIDYELVPIICDNIIEYRTNKLKKTMENIDKTIEYAIENKMKIQKLLNEVNNEVNVFLEII